MVTVAEPIVKEQTTQQKQLSEKQKAEVRVFLRRLAFGIASNIINCDNNKNE